MTNDLTTLSGALLEMKDQLISELADKGVTASYDPSTGLLGLIGRISDIQTGGSCYHIEFSEDSYTAVGGSATLEIMLQSNYQPLSGATVTVTGSDSSLYTGITDSDGLATVTVTNISAETIFTASYNNVSDTCTVTISSYIFYDEGSITGVSNYSTAHLLETGGTTTFTLTWDTTQNAYHIQTSPSKASMISIGALDGYTGDFKLEADIMRTSTNYVGGLCYCQKEKYGFFYGLGSSKFTGHHYVNGSWQGELNPTGSSSLNTWYHMELVKEGTTITISVYDSTGVTLLASTSKTYTDDENYYGFPMSNFYFKNIKAEAL